MLDASMLTTLSAQIAAIGPQEDVFLAELPVPRRVLDLGCGPGAWLERAHRRWPKAKLVGIDLEEALLQRIPVPCERRVGDALTPIADPGTFDLAVCRHVLQAVPNPERVVANLLDAVVPGGHVWLLAEDYSLIHFPDPALQTFWTDTALAYGAVTGTDMTGGRRAPTWLRRAGAEDVRVNWVVVDTQRVDRALFSTIWTAWRDGYSDIVADAVGRPRAKVRAGWDAMIAALADPDVYAAWHVPVICGRRPLG